MYKIKFLSKFLGFKFTIITVNIKTEEDVAFFLKSFWSVNIRPSDISLLLYTKEDPKTLFLDRVDGHSKRLRIIKL